MAGRMRGLLERLLARRRADAHDGVSDAELLRRFTRERDDAAFELLVWRHGAMVLGLCRRAVRDEQLAEDAFQAVFLVLARKAGAIRGNLGGWLFKVARRVSDRALKKRPAVQAAAETPAAPAPDGLEHGELTALLDAEIARLPERLRRPVVLCYLGDRSTEDAARELGCPRGTVLSRLATARKRLAARLTRRGVTLPATLATAGLGGRLVSSATASASTFRSGSFALSAATQLADGVLRSMSRTSLLTAFGGVVLAATLATGVGWVAAEQGSKGMAASGDAPAGPPAPPAPPPKIVPDATKPAQPDPLDARLQLDKKIKTLEQLAESVRVEIEAMEKNIELIARAGGAADNEVRAALLQRRLAEAEAEYFKVGRELTKLEAELAILKKRLDEKNAPVDQSLIEEMVSRDETVRAASAVRDTARKNLDSALKANPNPEAPVIRDLKEKLAEAQQKLDAIRKKVADEVIAKARAMQIAAVQQRINELALTIEVQKEVREKLKIECDALKKLLQTTAATNVDLDRLRKAVEPQREFLERINRELLLLRAQRHGVTFTPMSDTDAKLDTVLRELAALRKEVRELKELAKQPK